MKQLSHIHKRMPQFITGGPLIISDSAESRVNLHTQSWQYIRRKMPTIKTNKAIYSNWNILLVYLLRFCQYTCKYKTSWKMIKDVHENTLRSLDTHCTFEIEIQGTSTSLKNYKISKSDCRTGECHYCDLGVGVALMPYDEIFCYWTVFQ